MRSREWFNLFKLTINRRNFLNNCPNLFGTNIMNISRLIIDAGYPHDGRADKDSYPHDGRADKDSYPHDGRADKDSYPQTGITNTLC